LLWQPVQTNFLVTDEECWARGFAVGALPLWQSAQREPDTLAPACLIAWQLRQFLTTGAAVP
jgi:hypothetical protein